MAQGRARVLLWLGLAVLAVPPTARAGDCDNCVTKGPCPPPFCHHMEGPPRIKFKHGCPKPVCDPCTLPHYGYYQPCWKAWPFPPDWTHCAVPPPSVQLAPPAVPPYAPRDAVRATVIPATPERRLDRGDQPERGPDTDTEPSNLPAPRTTTPKGGVRLIN